MSIFDWSVSGPPKIAPTGTKRVRKMDVEPARPKKSSSADAVLRTMSADAVLRTMSADPQHWWSRQQLVDEMDGTLSTITRCLKRLQDAELIDRDYVSSPIHHYVYRVK